MWTTGTRVGAYEVLGSLGAGGMGEVYRARDSRLQRDVALKVLPASLLQDPERRARFEREARVLASLSHPNIAAIHGIEDMSAPGGQTPVLVLEFVEGQTLADRLTAGPIPVPDAIPMALQIAEGLEAAHDRGIIHRDLKPANVQITRDGVVKVLDFGLAKALDADVVGSQADPAHSPTITSARLGQGFGEAGTRLSQGSGHAATEIGVIMGTAAYMAPEQARGKTVDRRADVWAFGALLFEMLSGKRAFPGDTISDTLAAILATDPDWTLLPRETPASIRALIQRCLERDPRQRLQSIGEARIVLSGRAQAPPAEGVPAPTRGVSLLAASGIALAAIALTAAAALLWTRDSTTPAATSVRKLDLAIDGVQTRLDRVPVISPDGTRIAYVAGGKLWTRSLSEFASREVAGAAGGIYPFWSPDGRQLAFVRNFKLWRTSLEGGEPQLVGSVPGDMTGSGAGVWTAGGNFLVVGSDTAGIIEISAQDGSSREILPLDRKVESDFHELSELPGGKGLLFTTHKAQGADTIVVFAGGKRRDVLRLAGENLRSPVYDPRGYLLFGRETTRRGVWAVRFSLDSLQTEGSPFLVDASGNSPSVARDGTLAMVRRSDLPSELVWIDRGGSLRPQGMLAGYVPNIGPWTTMRLSPDGEKLAVGVSGESGDDLWLYDLKRGIMSPLSRGAQMTVWPTWMPDGTRVFFGGFVGARAWNVHSVTATETSTPQRLLAQADQPQWPCSISPDGKLLLYAQMMPTGTDLWIAPLDRPADAKPLMVTPAREQEGHFSPDGRWLAYISDESGPFELYVRRFPIGGDRAQVSSGGAVSVSWSSDGRELFYRGSGALMSVRLGEKDGKLEPSPPQRLFSISDPAMSQSYGAAPDGQRFLFARATGSDRVSVILNWTRSIAKD